MKEDSKLAKYVKGMGETLIQLSKEINKEGFTKDHEDLLAKIGSNILFEAKAYTYRVGINRD